MGDTNRAPPPRFTLVGLLELIAGIGLSLALVTQLEAFGVACALVWPVVILADNYVRFAKDRPAAKRHVRNRIVVPAIIMAIIGLLWSLPTVNSAREIEQTPCQRNLVTLKTAFEGYYSVHRHYPLPYIADANGKPIHSWRALILPFLDSELQRAYDMNEPWDGPHNRQLASRMPEVFRCPSAKRMPPGTTSYFCVVGPGRMGPATTLEREAFKDAPTLLLIESNTMQVNWLDPRDLTVDEVIHRREVAPGAFACHRDDEGGVWRRGPYFNCAMAQSFLGWPIRDDIAPETLKDILTIDGGEKVDPFDIAPKQYLWPGLWVLLGAEVVFVLFAILRRARIARRSRRDSKVALNPLHL